MKTVQLSQDVVPLAQFKARASELFRRLHREQRPVVITQNGKPAGVLITPQDYDRMIERGLFLAAVQEGLDDAENGRWIEDEDLDTELATAFGHK